MRWGWCESNPVKGIEKFTEEPRERYLTGEELRRLVLALDEWPNQNVANRFRLLILTGARKGEILGARWGEFDLEGGIWTKPSSSTKQKRTHRLPLSGAALALLREMKAHATNEFLFPGREPHEPVQDVKKSWREIRRKAGIPDVRIHDLRHLHASLLASAGHGLPVIGAMLGHSQPSVTDRYVHLFDDPLRQAADDVGALISKLSAEVRRPAEANDPRAT